MHTCKEAGRVADVHKYHHQVSVGSMCRETHMMCHAPHPMPGQHVHTSTDPEAGLGLHEHRRVSKLVISHRWLIGGLEQGAGHITLLCSVVAALQQVFIRGCDCVRMDFTD